MLIILMVLNISLLTKKFVSLLTAITLFTAARNFLFPLNLLISIKFLPISFFSNDSSVASATQLLCNASRAVNRRSALTQSKLEMRFLASSETGPQYSSWNSNCPFRILRNNLRWLSSMKGGQPPRRMYYFGNERMGMQVFCFSQFHHSNIGIILPAQ